MTEQRGLSKKRFTSVNPAFSDVPISYVYFLRPNAGPGKLDTYVNKKTILKKQTAYVGDGHES